MKNRIPQWPLRFFRWFCNPDFAEDIEGDLLERFVQRRKENKAARWLLLIDVCRLFRPGIIKPIDGTQKLNYYGMFKHNLLITFRTFVRHRSTFLINLTGLSTGLACVLFIYFWVADEVGKDKFHTQDDRIYQVYSNHHDASGTFTWRGVPGLLEEAIISDVPEVQYTVASTDAHEYTLTTGDDAFKVQGKFANEHFFDVFSYPLISGDAKTALADPSNVVITESLAKRLFNTTDALGKTVEFHFWDFKKSLNVSAVIADLTTATSDQFEFIMSWDYYHDNLVTFKRWSNYYGRIAVKLHEGAQKEVAEKKIDDIFKANMKYGEVDLFLTKYSDQYLYNRYENGKVAGGRIDYVKLFGVVALFILIIACINFINLSTAKASQRTKEIGVKKSMGASRSSLIGQYFTEAFCLTLIAMLLAFACVLLLMPAFNELSQKALSVQFDSTLFMGVGFITLIVSLFAGSYPSMYLSGLGIIQSLKPTWVKSSHSLGRKVLVVFQFTISLILIVATVLIQSQMNYVRTKNLGYDKENIVYLEREGKLLESHDAFVEELKNTSGVQKVAASGFMVGGANSTGGVHWEGKTQEQQVQFWETKAGYGLLDLLGMEMVDGRDFDASFGLDTASVIFNETAIRAMGLENPIGKTIRHYTGNKKIIGVVKDFNLVSLHTKIEPALFLFEPQKTHFIMAKIEGGKELEVIERMEELYESFNPNYPFQVRFLDQDYQALYESEERISSLSTYFAGLAILISCLGLFGLASFTTERRKKEIGIRKVMGSSVLNIVLLLSKDFTKMVLISILIGLPMSYLLAQKWLESFAYSIDLEWWFFGLAAFTALVIAWVTVGSQTFKSAAANPVESLKIE